MDHQACPSDIHHLASGATDAGSSDSPHPTWGRPVLRQHGTGHIAGGLNADDDENATCYDIAAS